MTHINDLLTYPDNILELVLYKAAATPVDSLADWKSMLPLLAVCRAWTKLAQPFVFSHVIIEFPTARFGGYFAYPQNDDDCTGWKSNAELIISSHCILMARRLTIHLPGICTPSHLRHIALDILQLDRVDWMHINTLNIIRTGFSNSPFDEPCTFDDSTAAHIMGTLDYFAQNMRNVSELDLGFTSVGLLRDHFCDRLSSVYGEQLQILRSWGFAPLPFIQLSRHIAVLELALGSIASRALPSICGETLRVLKLVSVPRNFAWHHFRYNIFVRPIVFRQLTTLHLDYRPDIDMPTEDEMQRKVSSGARNCDQLCFPALKELRVENCTPDCDLLYADVPFPELERVTLVGLPEYVRHCIRLKLGWVKDLKVSIEESSSISTIDLYSVTNHFFSSICVGRTATIHLYDRQVTIDPELVRWVNLTSFQTLRISYETLCKLIARLPNLSKLWTICLLFDTAQTVDLSFDSELFCSVDPLLPWGAKLACVTILDFSDESPTNVTISGIRAFILHTGALKDLIVPGDAFLAIDAFIGANKDRCPHLANVVLNM
ncbi:hypothetical protein GGI21_000938 [Coemansia aciculifera]|nr:hypothetical protein GGI21_000938 [Coemansia aciculifera]